MKRTYRNTKSFGTNSVRYFTKGDQHIVAHDTNCGEDIAPSFYKCPNIEEARLVWAKVVSLIKSNGYTELIAS